MKLKFFGLVLTGIVLLNFSSTFAQDYAETALLFSRTRPGGSARIQSLGGSQIALGGDYSSAASNPAGLGMFNRSEFTFSAGLGFHNMSANYLGNSMEADKTSLNIPGLSLVWHMPKESGSFLGGSFAITLSRTNDFNRETIYSAFNDQNSIIDYFIDQANGATTAQFDENGSEYNTPTGLAYFNYLIGAKSILDPPGPNDEYFTDATYGTQQEEINVKGGTTQWNISYGGNIGDQFFFGAGLGISSLKYKSQKIFTETFPTGDVLEFMQLNENLEIRGTGVNFTLGAIARPADFVQLGASFSTPTFYNLSETYSATMGTIWDNFDYFGDGSEILGDNTGDPIGTDLITSEYNLTTPLKFSTGVAFISKMGFITADVEFVNYSNAKYSSDGVSYSVENEDIKTVFKNATNFRIGAEYRYEEFRGRLGYSLQGKTVKSEFDVDNSITSLSGGVGYRAKNFYIDFALINSTSPKYYYQPYRFSDGSGPEAELKPRSTTGMITLGFTF